MQVGRSELVKTLEIGIFALSFFLLFAAQSSLTPSEQSLDNATIGIPLSSILIQP